MLAALLPPVTEKPPPEMPVPTPVPTLPPTPQPPPDEFNPKKQFEEPALWKYDVDTTHPIWIARNYKDYILPYNAIIQYFIDHIKFEPDQNILVITFKSDDSIVRFKYRSDNSRICKKAGMGNNECYNLGDPVFDFWINPDYYIWTELEGDCEDYALMWSSVFENLKIPYMMVSGWAENVYPDWWVEFKWGDKIYIAQVNLNAGMPAELDKINRKIFKPVEMFNKSADIQPYREWYKDYQSNPKAILVG